ncbi:MAG: peptidoglycan-binding domain-containing protein [Candidatus Acidiferrales bacterium]
MVAAAALWFLPASAQSRKAGATKPSGAKSSAKATPTKAQKKKRPVSRRRRARRQSAPTAERVREIQSALAKAGHYQATPNGKWDGKSVEAMKAFQEANGLRPSGKLNARSLQLLGLGSETAGLAPPRTPAAVTSGSRQ